VVKKRGKMAGERIVESKCDIPSTEIVKEGARGGKGGKRGYNCRTTGKVDNLRIRSKRSGKGNLKVG